MQQVRFYIMAKTRKLYTETVDALTTFIDVTTITGAGRVTIAQKRGKSPSFHTTLTPSEARKLAGRLFRLARRAEEVVRAPA
jgi:uroporphyrinogen-III decarboxylase